MILGIGTDIVDIQRFATWHTKSQAELLRVFSPEEIAYCLHENNQLSAERFAVRFAAKEAFFKAFHAMLTSQNKTDMPSLFTVQKEVSVVRLAGGTPTLAVNWHTLLQDATIYPRVHISLSHAQTTAVAIVILA